MKKIISILMAISVFASLVACGTDGDTTQTSPSPSAGVQTNDSSNVPDEYVYGTATLTWAQFWANEDITYSDEHDFDAVNTTPDSEGSLDLGGFDAVTRATSKHGIYAAATHYAVDIHGTDNAGNEVTVSFSDMADPENLIVGFGEGEKFYATQDGENTVYTIAEPAGEHTTYTMIDYQVTGFRAWPVKVLSSQVEAAKKAVNFTLDDQVTEETGRLKTITVEEDGNVTASAMTAANGAEVEYAGEIGVSYKTKYGDYAFISVNDCGEEWGPNIIGAIYYYYGDVNPEETPDAVPIATYGTKFVSDVWWKSSRYTLELGINQSYRQGGSGETVGPEKTGYWVITIMAVGYEDYTFCVKTEGTYEADVTAEIADDNATITLTGLSKRDLNNDVTAITVDGVAVSDYSSGVFTVAEPLSVGPHTVNISFASSRDLALTVVAMSDLQSEDIKLIDNVLSIPNGELSSFLANIDGIAVNGITIDAEDMSTAAFNEDGSVAFDRVISSMRSGETIVFPEGASVENEMIIQSIGYPIVILYTTPVV